MPALSEDLATIMNLTLGVVTDLHFGPEARFFGKLRKLTAKAEALTRRFADAMRAARPDFVVNLGDAIEDESPEADVERYALCQRLLAGSGVAVVNVAGNHDTIHLSGAQLREQWGLPPDGPLYRSFDRGGVHVVILCTHEEKGVEVTIDEAQLAWLEADLAENPLPVLILMHHSASEQLLADNRWFGKAPHLALVKQRRRLRALFEGGRVILVLNGHVHWNHLDVIAGIPYVTVQSLIENVDDDAPGRAAAAHALVRIGPRRIAVDVAGTEPCRYQFER